MIVEFNELGYVKKATVNLSKDLIILCGPNNTGKTYVAYAIYGLMKQSSLNVSRVSQRSITKPIINLFDKESFDIIEGFERINLPLINNISREFLGRLSSIFAYSSDLFNKTQIKIEINDIEQVKTKLINSEFKSVLNFPNASISLFKESGASRLKYLLVDNKSAKEAEFSTPAEMIKDYAAREILKLYLNVLFPKSYIAPAERIAINLFSKELSLQRNVLVDQLLELKDGKKVIDPFDLVTRRASRYPLPVRDSLEIAEDLNNFKKTKSDFNDFADEIESGILKGKVNISKEGEVQFKPQKGKVNLPIHLSSSSVKSLSNLVIYFRHLANKNDFIIIDEPELNLHPDNQVIIARIVAKIVNKGFKVLINTHSDYIIRELNNLIMLSQKEEYKEEYLDKFNYSKDEVLKPEQVEALLFHYETKKVESLEVTESGFEVETIDSITNELNNRSEALYFNTFPTNDE